MHYGSDPTTIWLGFSNSLLWAISKVSVASARITLATPKGSISVKSAPHEPCFFIAECFEFRKSPCRIMPACQLKAFSGLLPGCSRLILADLLKSHVSLRNCSAIEAVRPSALGHKVRLFCQAFRDLCWREPGAVFFNGLNMFLGNERQCVLPPGTGSSETVERLDPTDNVHPECHCGALHVA